MENVFPNNAQTSFNRSIMELGGQAEFNFFPYSDKFDYAARGFSSIIVDKENFVNIFGGKISTGSNDLNQLWRGRINRLIPKE